MSSRTADLVIKKNKTKKPFSRLNCDNLKMKVHSMAEFTGVTDSYAISSVSLEIKMVGGYLVGSISIFAMKFGRY